MPERAAVGMQMSADGGDTDVTMRTHITNIVRACVLFGTLPDPECATFPATARTANIGPCIGHYQAGPLQLGPSR